MNLTLLELTSWLQAYQRYYNSIDKIMIKFAYDLEYLKKKNLLFDISIILATIPTLIKRWVSFNKQVAEPDKRNEFY